MFFDNFLAFSLALQFWIEISGTSSAVFYVVVGPLAYSWGGECAAKEIFVTFIGGGVPVSATRGRVTSKKKAMTFDSTMGFPGEDVAVQFS